MQGLRPGRAVLGLDIGAGAVKVVELTRGGIRSCGLSLRLRAEDAARAAGHEAIRDALRQAAPRTRRAVVGLDVGEIIEHRFALPTDLPALELEEQVRLQAGQAAPFRLEEAAFDYIPETTGGRAQGYRMAIARAATVETLCRTVRLAGLTVAAVDVTAFAVQRALAEMTDRDVPLAVLDAGHRQSRLSVHLGGGTVFHHRQPFGCSALTGRLSSAYGLSEDDAKQSLADCALPDGAASGITKLFLKDLARHAARAIQLYLTSRRDAGPPEKMLLWGGAALVHGACKALRDELDLPVEAVSAPAALNGGDRARDFSPALFGAYALALNDHA